MHANHRTLLVFSIAFAVGCGGVRDSGSGGNVGFGGAQDIGQFRGILESGGIPGAETLDANGFFNEHYVELPPPDCGQTLCAHALLSVGRDWVQSDYQATMQIAMNTPIDPTTLERPPLSMVLVVDTSGSMLSDNRLEYVKSGMLLLIDQLEPGDRLGIVEYNSAVNVIADLSEELDAETLKARVQALRAAGATNIYDGLSTGMQMVATALDSQRQNRVILLSDGVATAGDTSSEAIISMATTYITEGIGLTTIGVGSDFNVELMRGLAERGAGNFYFLESPQAVQEVFTEELDYFIQPIALDIELEVTPGAPYRFGEILGTRLWKNDGETGRVSIPAAFVSSRVDNEPTGGRRGGGSSIFVRMLPQSDVITDLDQVASVKLSYRLPGSTERLSQTVSLTNPNQPGETPEQTWTSHVAMEKNYAMYNIFLGLREAARDADSDYSCALAVIEDVRAEAAIWNQTRNDPDITADIELMDLFAANLRDAGAYPPDPQQACDDGYYPGDPGDDPHYHHGPPCSLGGDAPSAGFFLLLMIGALVSLRRRRIGFADPR